MTVRFDHEKLRVYQLSIGFIAWAAERNSEIAGNGNIKDQFIRAATSIGLNIAEGNGKFSLKDRNRFFDIARGSAYECAACLDVMVALKAMSPDTVEPGKGMLLSIVNMLIRLMQNQGGMVREAEEPYGVDGEEFSSGEGLEDN